MVNFTTTKIIGFVPLASSAGRCRRDRTSQRVTIRCVTTDVRVRGAGAIEPQAER
jgi:hypothetical protein